MSDADRDHESAILLAVGGLLHREIAIDDLLQRLVDHIAAAMAADRGTIYLLDRSSGELYSRAARLPELPEIRLARGQGIAGHVAATGETVNVPTAHAENRFYQGVDAVTGYRTRSILAVPMRDPAGAIVGVIQLLNKKDGSFSATDGQRLVHLGEQAALALAATTLYDDLARVTDSPPPLVAALPWTAQFNRIVGGSEALQRACRLTAKAAASQATVLLRGESGTGKELFARAVHVNSARSEQVLTKVDCAALPESLIDNELFGHERGAYTGADARALGKFDMAHGGTIFLDEIGELPLSVQGKLLRVLQDREFLRIGGTAPIRVDVRVVAATNRDLEAMVADGRFRQDLYFRIKVVQIELPPLRERGAADIARLARHFVLAAAKRHGRPVPRVSKAALLRLARYRWPGNVRELENCIESAIVVMDGDSLDVDDLPLPESDLLTREAAAPTGRQPGTPLRSLADAERDHIAGVLQSLDGNQSAAAKVLDIGRNTLARKIKKYGL